MYTWSPIWDSVEGSPEMLSCSTCSCRNPKTYAEGNILNAGPTLEGGKARKPQPPAPPWAPPSRSSSLNPNIQGQGPDAESPEDSDVQGEHETEARRSQSWGLRV